MPDHSEGESLREREKKRLGRNMPPQNGVFGGRAEACEGSEENTIDQARILGGPDRRFAQGENSFLSQINFWAEISISLKSSQQ